MDTRSPLVTAELLAVLGKLTKGQLLDLYVQALAARSGSCDAPPTIEDAAQDVAAMMAATDRRAPAWTDENRRHLIRIVDDEGCLYAEDASGARPGALRARRASVQALSDQHPGTWVDETA